MPQRKSRSRKSPKKVKKSVSRPRKSVSRPKKTKSPKKSTRPTPKKSRSRKARSYRFSDELPSDISVGLVNELLSELQKIKEKAVVKTEINNLISEIPTFLRSTPEERQNTMAAIDSRVKDLDKEVDRSNKEHPYSVMENCMKHLEKLEKEKEEKGEKRTYPEWYFYDGDQELSASMNTLMSFIMKKWPDNDLRKDLLHLLNAYDLTLTSVTIINMNDLIYKCIENTRLEKELLEKKGRECLEREDLERRRKEGNSVVATAKPVGAPSVKPGCAVM